MKKLFKSRRAVVFFLACVLVGVALPVVKADAIFVSPSRLIIEDGQRTGRFLIFNKTKKTHNVTFGWERLVMQEGGKIKRLEDGETYPGYNPADSFITFSPRRTTLKPGETQNVRLLIQRPADLPPGEYHSHFKVVSEEVKSSESGGGTEGLKMGIDFRVTRSLPIFVHNGQTEVNVKIRSATIVRGEKAPSLRLELDNNSTRSLYAGVRLECDTGAGEPVVRQNNSVRIYSEVKSLTRDVPVGDLPLDSCRTLNVKLVGNDDFQYHNLVIDQAPVTR